MGTTTSTTRDAARRDVAADAAAAGPSDASAQRDGAAPATAPEPSRWQRTRARARGQASGTRTPPEPPFSGVSALRVLLSLMLSVLCLLTVGGAVILLMLWQQGRDNGVLTTQIDRAWELIDLMREIERWVAFGAVAAAMGWIVVAAINAGRATGQHRNAMLAALSLPTGLAAAWLIGREVAAGSGDLVAQAAGFALQATMLLIPMIFLERVAVAAEARRRPLRVVYVMGVLFLASLQFLGGLSTIEPVEVGEDWGRYGAYLLIGGLIQVVGALAANEAARAVEDAALQRFELRSRFSEALLAQAAMT